jgi:hypothetical protein
MNRLDRPSDFDSDLAADQVPARPRAVVARLDVDCDEGLGIDRLVTAIAFLATLALILLAPLG